MKKYGLVIVILVVALTITLAPRASASHEQDMTHLADALQTLQEAKLSYRRVVYYFGKQSVEASDAQDRIEAANRAVAAQEVQLSRDLLLLDNTNNQAKLNYYSAF